MSENIYTELRRLTPKVTGGLVRMREETFKDAVVPSKYKVLAALAIVVVTKCEPCVKAYTKMAYQLGVTQEELLEFLNVAMTEGGCPGEQWALKAYQVYKELKEGKEIEEEVCCKLEDIK
ncbi:MAG: carboxymuconolactone decarboxylase family protein [Thermodesulfovibrionales bacterium]